MLDRLIREIHRRSLWQVLAIFTASGWAVLQVLDTLINHGILPAWVFKAGLVLLLLGLPVVLATAFVQEGLRGASSKTERSGDSDAAPATVTNPAEGTGSLDRARTRGPNHHRLLTWRNAILGGMGAFALLGMGSGGWMAMRALGIGPVGTLAAQGVITRGAEVVLADFDSGDDAELGDVVTRTLRIDLRQSRMLRIVERADLVAPLERMSAAADTRITRDVAIQLAERQGFAAVVSGEVARAGTGYVLTASIIAGDGFRTAAEFRETARSDDQLIDAIERLSRKMRDKAGESLRSVQGGASLAQVTTSSLPALREYTRGEVLDGAGDRDAALPHYERAVALDSTFAMAHRKIATTLTILQIRRADAVRAFRRAYDLRDRLPALERELATATYMQFVAGDVTAAATAYERALAIDSTSLPVRVNLGNAYADLGRYADAAREYEAAIRLRPTAAAFRNLSSARFSMGDLPGALAAVDSGMAVLPGWHGGSGVKAHYLVAVQQFAAADSVSRIYENAARSDLDRRLNAQVRIWLSAFRGQLRAAERVLEDPVFADDPITRASVHASLDVMRGDTAKAIARVKQALADHDADDDMYTEALYALTQAGAGAEAAAVLAVWQAAVPDDQLGVYGRINRQGAIASTQRARRDYDGALRTLDDMRRRWPDSEPAMTYDRAQTYDEMGNATLAIEWYEKSLAAYNYYAMYAAPQITRALRRLAELYDAQGNDAKAIEYYARSVELWKDADPELQPRVRAAQRRLEALMAQRG